MSNELLVVFYILATLAVAYLWFYPKVIGNNVKLMAWMDIVITAIPVSISALLFWTDDPSFRFFWAELNWLIFTLVTMFVIELPIFWLYIRARGLNQQYLDLFRVAPKGSPDAAWASASVDSVERQLSDTKWDGLRTRGARRFLLWGSNLSLILGTVFLFNVDDTPLAALSLIHILLIFVFWFLLRQSVRLVADAPEEALDEMLLQVRDRSYLIAYRYLAAIAVFGAIALMSFAVFSDFQEGSDGFNYVLELTWPQVQAVFWLIFGYAFMLPSMAMISIDLKRETRR